MTLDRPGQPRVARALTLLLAEINTSPPTLPGDGLPITYHTLPQPRDCVVGTTDCRRSGADERRCLWI